MLISYLSESFVKKRVTSSTVLGSKRDTTAVISSDPVVSTGFVFLGCGMSFVFLAGGMDLAFLEVEWVLSFLVLE